MVPNYPLMSLKTWNKKYFWRHITPLYKYHLMFHFIGIILHEYINWTKLYEIKILTLQRERTFFLLYSKYINWNSCHFFLHQVGKISLNLLFIFPQELRWAVLFRNKHQRISILIISCMLSNLNRGILDFPAYPIISQMNKIWCLLKRKMGIATVFLRSNSSFLDSLKTRYKSLFVLLSVHFEQVYNAKAHRMSIVKRVHK